MRRKSKTHSVRGVIETLERRTMLTGVAPGNASIYGTAFYDLNGNGIQDLNEPPVVGGTVFIDLHNTATPTLDDPVSTTDATGQYSFTNIAGGTYNIRIVTAPGYSQPAPGYLTVNLPSGSLIYADIAESNGSSNFSVTTISGILFNDFNQNGNYEPANEQFLAGDTVYLDLNHNGKLDPGEPSTTTNNVGFYSFSVTPGEYDIRCIPRPGFHQDPPGFISIIANSGDQLYVNVGENNRTTISGFVFLDSNANGVQDPGEPGVAGETVYLDLNYDGSLEAGTQNPSNGQFDNGEPWVQAGADGLFVFTGLAPGTYRLTTSSIHGYLVDSPGYIDVTVTQGQDLVQNLGEGAPADVSGVVFNDANANGVQDAGEAGLPNQTVFLDVNNNGVDDTAGVGADGLPQPPEPFATTDLNGNFDFSTTGSPSLNPGTYTLRLETPAGGVPTAPANPSHSITFTLTSGETLTGQALGFETPDLSISVLKFSTMPTLTNVKKPAEVRITNVGLLPINGLVGVTLYASTNSVLDTASAYIIGGMNGIPVKLKPGQGKNFRFNYAYPTQLPLNSYYVTAAAVSSFVENNIVNNFSPPIGPIQVGPPYNDLALTFAVQPQLLVYPGQQTAVSMLLTNDGNVDFKSKNVTFLVYLTNQAQIEPTDMAVERVIFKNVHLNVGQSKIFTIGLSSPGASLGNKFVILDVDSGNPLGESNLGNNIAIPNYPVYFE